MIWAFGKGAAITPVTNSGQTEQDGRPIVQALQPLRWQKARIEKIERRTARTRSFFLKLDEPFMYEAGQHIDVCLTGPDGNQVRRGYSIASAPEMGPDRLELCIEELEGGEVSPFFHMTAAPGDTLELRGPLGGHFIWNAEEGGPVLLIGGGSGVVPLASMARHRAASDRAVPMALLYSVRTWDDVIFRDEFLEMHGRRDGFDLVLTLTRDPGEREGVARRRIDSGMVLQAVDQFPAPPKRVYICGSNPFVDAAARACMDAGLAERTIRTERYGG